MMDIWLIAENNLVVATNSGSVITKSAYVQKLRTLLNVCTEKDKNKE